MPKNIDFNSLLEDLFQEDMPVKEKVYRTPQTKKDGACFSRALSEIFLAGERGADNTDKNEANNSLLQACSLYAFMREVVMECFGMGYDYAISDRNGMLLKSWFTIPEVIEAAESRGYQLTIACAREYLERLIKQRYIETDNYRYRRCAFWDKRMEKYLRYSG